MRKVKRFKTITTDRPGKIGATYMNKKTKQICHIVDFKDKYKTLIVEYENLHSDVMTYGTFRREFEEVK